jgi:uncharacterized protein YjiS (DUF1127 family)
MKIVLLVEGWMQRRRQRLMLRTMSDHMLHDIGITRSDAYEESRKPFWLD